MEEALRLMAVERDIGRVQVQHDLLGRGRVRFDVKIAQQPVDRFRRVADLVIAPCAPHQLQPVQRALTGQRLVQLPLATEQGHERIRAQLLVVVQVLVAQRQPVDALRQHRRQLVSDEQRRAAIREAGGQTAQQVDLPLHLAQQQRTAIAGHLSSREPGLNAPRKMCREREDFLITLCHQKGRLRTATTTSTQRSYAMKRRPFQTFFNRNSPPSPTGL